MENNATLKGHPCVMPCKFVNVCVSPWLVVHLLVVTVLYHSLAVWYNDGASWCVFASSVRR
eukprot:12919662-Prorocentrum_lima.AAC.1